MNTVIPVGAWCLITGDRMMQQDYFNKRWPQGIFGRVVEVKKNNLGYGHTYWLRCYFRQRKSKGEKIERHPHLKTSKQYLLQL